MKDRFWDHLNEEVKKCRRKAAVIVMSDMNGRVGSWTENVEVVGRYGEEIVNEDGECC